MQHIIFDMDGVIVDSEPHWHRAENEFIRGLVPSWGPEDHKRLLGMSVDSCFKLISKEYGVALSRDEFVNYFSQQAAEIYGKHVELVEGCVSCLARFRAAGCMIGLCSSSQNAWIELVIKRFGLNEYFDAFVGAESISGEAKPAPDLYLCIAEQLNVAPANCIAIEDSPKGVASAKAAGMRCVGFRNGSNDDVDLSEADTVYRGFDEITIENLRSLSEN